MGLNARIEALRMKHSELEHELEEESSRPSPNMSHLTEIKRQKLRIKDELARASEH